MRCCCAARVTLPAIWHSVTLPNSYMRCGVARLSMQVSGGRSLGGLGLQP